MKNIVLPDTLVPDLATTRIMSFKDKIKNRETISYIDWINFKKYFVYDQNLSDKQILKSQLESLSKCKKQSTRKNMLKQFMGRFSVIFPLFYQVKLIVYTSSNLNKQIDKIHRCSKSESIIP